MSLADLSSVATAVSVAIAAGALVLAHRQARTTFEDSLNREYRETARALPLSALLGKELPSNQMEEALPDFYRYVDLCNEQVYLRMKGRVRASTWREWRSGIENNLKRPAFRKAFERIREESHADFDELAELIDSGFHEDPRRWRTRHR